MKIVKQLGVVIINKFKFNERNMAKKNKKPIKKTVAKAVNVVRLTVEERKVDAKVWKKMDKNLNGFPNVGVHDWRPILEKLTRKEIHHKGTLYKQCHKFVMNARDNLKKR